MDDDEHLMQVDLAEDTAEMLVELENNRRRVYQQMRELIRRRRAYADRTEQHIEQLKTSIFNIKTISIDELLLYYGNVEANNDREMLKKIRDIVAPIDLDDPNFDFEKRRDTQRKICEEVDFQGFITRAERGLHVYRMMCYTSDAHVIYDTVEVENHGTMLMGMLLKDMRSKIFEVYSTVDKFQNLLSLAAFFVTRFIVYWSSKEQNFPRSAQHLKKRDSCGNCTIHQIERV